MSKILNVVNTVRYMTPRQWKYRLYYTARNKLKRRIVHPSSKRISCCSLPLNYLNDIHKVAAIKVADAICENRFNTISGIEKSFGKYIDWDLKDESYRLVCFKLNSFQWILDLSDAYKYSDDLKYVEKGFQLIKDWHEKNGRIIVGDKWNPYVIAERLMNWIGFCSQYCDIANENIITYASWIHEQAYELRQSVEYQLGANHLLSEGRALLAAGSFLKDENLYKYGKRLLRNEYKEQFLDDGGHYERSVSYHVESLQQYFEAITIMLKCHDMEAYQFIKMIRPAYNFLNGMISVLGKIPLFNDSAYDYPFYDARDFLSTANLLYSNEAPNAVDGEYYERWNLIDIQKEPIFWESRVWFQNTGYLHYKIKNKSEKYSFYFDAADCGPDSNLGHTHADALSVLLSNTNKELLVDSGVFTYQAGEKRNLCRSTKAHNTVEIDGRNSAEIWSAFRVARRGHSRVLEYQNLQDKLKIVAAHDGYQKCLKNSVLHIREIDISDGKIKIRDTLKSRTGHQAVSRFHIGTECSIEQIDNMSCLIDYNVMFHCSLPIRIVECEIADYFGQIKFSKCIEIQFNTDEVNDISTTILISDLER